MVPEIKSEGSDFQYSFMRDSLKDKFIIEPNSLFMKVWSFVIILSLTYTATIMPFRIAFFPNDMSSSLFMFDTVLDFVFLFDIYVNFNIPITNKNKVVSYSRKKITLGYLKTWFTIDLISSLPINLMT